MLNSVLGEVHEDIFEMQSFSVPSKWILEVIGTGAPARTVTVKIGWSRVQYRKNRFFRKSHLVGIIENFRSRIFWVLFFARFLTQIKTKIVIFMLKTGLYNRFFYNFYQKYAEFDLFSLVGGYICVKILKT